MCQLGFIISFTFPPCVRDFSAETWLLLHFLLLPVCLSGSGCLLTFLNAGNSHPFISLLSSVLSSHIY